MTILLAFVTLLFLTFLVYQFVTYLFTRHYDIPVMLLTVLCILLLGTAYVLIVYAQAQGKIDVIESYCGKTVSPLSLIFYPEIEDKVILDCEQKTVPPSSEVVQ